MGRNKVASTGTASMAVSIDAAVEGNQFSLSGIMFFLLMAIFKTDGSTVRGIDYSSLRITLAWNVAGRTRRFCDGTAELELEASAG